MFGSTGTTMITNVVNQYIGVGAVSTASAAAVDVPIPATNASNFTATVLRIVLDQSPGGTAGYVFTVTKNGTDTSLKCTVTAPALKCVDVTAGHSFNAGGGDTIGVHVTVNGAPGPVLPRWSVGLTQP